MKSWNDKYKVIQVQIHFFKKEISCLQHAQQDGHEHIHAEGDNKSGKAAKEIRSLNCLAQGERDS